MGLNGKEPRQEELTLAQKACMRLARWKGLLTQWQLGYRKQDDPEAAAIRDQRELLLILRAEVDAILQVLVDSRIIKQADFDRALEYHANKRNNQLAARFPGYASVDEGMLVDQDVAKQTRASYNFRI